MGEVLGNPWWTYVVLGLGAGLLSGMLGVGSGIILVPGLALLMALPQKSAQGTSLAIMVPMALVGAVRYKLSPQATIEPLCVALLAAGALPGALLGAELAQHLPGAVLRKIFAAFMIVVGVRMAWPQSWGLLIARQGRTDGSSQNRSSGNREDRDGIGEG